MKRRRLDPAQFNTYVTVLDHTPIGECDGAPVLVSHTASWAVWNAGDVDEAPTDQWLRQQDLTTSVILLGANWGSNPTHIPALVEHRWATFHTDPTKTARKPKPGQDELADLSLLPHQKLKRAIQRHLEQSPVSGAYMTDLVKMVPTSDTLKLLAQRLDDDALRPSLEAFARELRLARQANDGQPPLILAFGQNTYRMLLGGNWHELRHDVSPPERSKGARKTYQDAPLTTAFADVVQTELRVPVQEIARCTAHYARQGSITPEFLAASISRAIARHDDAAVPDVEDYRGYQRLRAGLG